jgi:DNA ligase-1
MLANKLPPKPVADYFNKGNNDGKGHLDGEQLLTRGVKSGCVFAWFTAGWPSIPLTGNSGPARAVFNGCVDSASSSLTQDRRPVLPDPFHGFLTCPVSGPFTERIHRW